MSTLGMAMEKQGCTDKRGDEDGVGFGTHTQSNPTVWLCVCLGVDGYVQVWVEFGCVCV